MICAEDRIEGFVAGVPDGHAGMIPIVAHPVGELAGHLGHVEGAGVFLAPGAGPDEELVLDEQPRFVGDFQPLVRHRPDAKAKRVPVHFLRRFHEQLAQPLLIPRQAAAVRVLEEAVQRDVRAAQVIRFAVEIKPVRLACRRETRACRSAS